jgi:transposase
MRRKRTASEDPQSRPMIHSHAAAIDVGATMRMAAVGPECVEEPACSFWIFTTDLRRMADWFEVFLVNARDAKRVPGRKTDVNDAQWLQQLHS